MISYYLLFIIYDEIFINYYSIFTIKDILLNMYYLKLIACYLISNDY